MNPQHQIKVSVIIPVYNEEKTIIDVLEKVNHQKINSISMEIIVINDGSKDHSLELLKNLSLIHISEPTRRYAIWGGGVGV